MGDKNDEISIGLCLSGGGLRATFFHLGVICALREMGLVGKVKEIYSVSGGSILAAHLASNWTVYQNGSPDELDTTVTNFVKLAKRDIRGRVVRRWILSWPLVVPGLVSFDRIFFLRQEYSKALNIGTETIANQSAKHVSSPAFHFLSTSFNTGETCSFSKSRFVSTDGTKDSIDIAGDGIPLSFAVAASSAFPPLFPPARLTSRIAGKPSGHAFAPIALTDGGIYDNLGFAKFAELENSKKTACNFVIVSDGSGAFVTDVNRPYRTLISRTVRSTDILMRRLADETIRIAEARGEKMGCRLSISEVLPDSQFSSAVQEALGNIRTDLDRFSDEEVALLLVRGYEVCKSRLRNFATPATPLALYERYKSKLITTNLPAIVDKSSRRRIGLFNLRDWTTYAILTICVLPVLLLLFGVQRAQDAQQQLAQQQQEIKALGEEKALAQRQISFQERRIDQLGEQVNIAVLNTAPSSPTPQEPVAQVNRKEFTVFIQFAGYSRDVVVKLASDLSQYWKVPGADQGGERISSASRLREVRFGPDLDKLAATALAQDVERSSLIGGEVALRKVPGIPKGTLELWIGLR